MYDIRETIVWTDPRLSSITEIRLRRCYHPNYSHIGHIVGQLLDGSFVEVADPLDCDIEQFFPVQIEEVLRVQARRDGIVDKLSHDYLVRHTSY